MSLQQSAKSDADRPTGRISGFYRALSLLPRRIRDRWSLYRVDSNSKGQLTALLTRESMKADPVGDVFLGVLGDDGEPAVRTFRPAADPVIFKRTSYPATLASLPMWLGELPTCVGYRPLKRAVFLAPRARFGDRELDIYVKLRRGRARDAALDVVPGWDLWPELLARSENGRTRAELWASAGPGRLREALTSDAPDIDDYLRRVGAAISRLQSESYPGLAELPSVSAPELVRRTRPVLDRYHDFFPTDARDHASVLDTLAVDIDGSDRDAPLVTAHGDLHDGQIFLSNGTGAVRFIDPDSLCRAPLEWDVANLGAHLILRTLQHPEEAWATDPRSRMAALLDGFRSALPDGLADRFSADRHRRLVGLTLCRLVGVYGSRPPWRHIVPRLSRTAREWIHGGRRLTALLLLVGLVPTATGSASPTDVVPSRLRNGLWIEVQGDPRPGKRLKAEQVEVKMPGDHRRRQLRGPIESFDADTGTLVLFERAVRVTGTTTVRMADGSPGDRSMLVPGRQVKVSGLSPTPDRIPRADEIRLLGADELDDEVEVEGFLEDFSREGDRFTFDVNGVRMRLADDAEITVRPDAEALLAPPLDVFPGSRDRSKDEWQPPGTRFLFRSLTIGGRITGRVRSENEFDLNNRLNGNRVDSVVDTRAYLRWNPNPWVEGYVELRWSGARPLGTEDSVPRITAGTMWSGPTYLMLRQRSHPWLAGQIGRIDVEEEREWFYDQNLDGVRAFLVTWRSRLDVGAYRTDITPDSESKDRKYLIASLQLPPVATFQPELHVLRRQDRREPGNDRIFYGGRLPLRLGWLETWSDWLFVRGDFRGKEARSWGFDNGLMLRWRWPFRASVYGSYAFGSGDADRGNGVDREFRDTGLADNNDNRDGLKSFKYYGELTDPELSNIHIRSLGAGVYLTSWLSVDVIRHRYLQDQYRDRFRSDVPIRPTGLDKDLGTELDVIAGVRGLLPVELEASWARFTPGGAFETQAPATRFQVVAEWRQ